MHLLPFWLWSRVQIPPVFHTAIPLAEFPGDDQAVLDGTFGWEKHSVCIRWRPAEQIRYIVQCQQIPRGKRIYGNRVPAGSVILFAHPKTTELNFFRMLQMAADIVDQTLAEMLWAVLPVDDKAVRTSYQCSGLLAHIRQISASDAGSFRFSSARGQSDAM